MSQVEPKAVDITIKYDDGSIISARGYQAEQIMDWYHGCEGLSIVHGASYGGPIFTKLVPEVKDDGK